VETELNRLLQRGVEALERLAEDPVIQVATSPPNCPHCERINPVIRVEESANTGSMAEFVIRAHCQHCNSIFYAVPLQWGTVRSLEEVKDVIAERVEAGGYSHNDHK